MCPPFYTKRWKKIVYFFCLNLMLSSFKSNFMLSSCDDKQQLLLDYLSWKSNFYYMKFVSICFDQFFNLTQNTQFVDIYFKQILMYRPHKNDKTNRKQQRPRKMPNQTRVKKRTTRKKQTNIKEHWVSSISKTWKESQKDDNIIACIRQKKDHS